MWSVGATHASPLRAGILDALVKALESRGMLDVLRHGIKLYGKKIQMAFFKPAFGLNPEATARYSANRLDIIARFMHLEVKETKQAGKVIRKETMVFSRYEDWGDIAARNN